MADTLLSEQQVKQLIDTGSLDLSEALKLMPQTAYNLLANDLTQAIHSGDMKKINTLMTTAHSQISPDVYNKLQHTVQKTAYTFQVVKQVEHYQKVAEKKEQGKALTENDNKWLAFREKLEQQVDKVEGYYPEAFADKEQNAEPIPMELDSFLSNENTEKSAMRSYSADETQSFTHNETTDGIQFQPTQNARVEQSAENTTIQDNSKNTNTVYTDFENVNTDSYTIPQNQTANSSEGIAQYIDMYEPSLNPQNLSNTIRSGNTSEMTAESMKEREVLNSLQSTPKNPDEQAIQNMNDTVARNNMEAGDGYINDFKLSDKDKRDTDWDNIFQQAGKHLQAGGEKNLDDFCMKMVTGTILAGLELLTQWANEQRKNMKEDAKTARQKRLDYIDANLKNKGMTMTSLSSKLARDSKLWILNDPAYKNLPKTEPYTKQQKYLLKKQQFANELPKMPNGDINYAKLTSSQKKQLHSYIEDYAKSGQWKNFVYESTGIVMMADEMKKMTQDAKGMRVRVGAEELMPTPQTERTPIQNMGNNQPQPSIPPHNNDNHNPLSDSPYTNDGNNRVSMPIQPATPIKSENQPEFKAPKETQNDETPSKPAVALATPTTDKINENKTIESQPKITSPYDNHSAQPAAPVVGISEEEKKLREEAQSAIKMEPLDDLNISGSLKKPQVIRLADGTTFAVSNANMEELKRKEEEIKRKKEANDDMRNKNREQQRMLANVRSGKEATVQAPTQTRQAGMGGRS